MVVTCPECHTRFTLADSRIPGPTAKVRCSRCRHVFRITREGQVVAPDWRPPEEPLQETLPEEEVQRETPLPPVPEPAVPSPPPPQEVVAGEETSSQAAVTGAEAPVSPGNRHSWWVLLALFLAAVVAGGLGWLAWEGSLPAPLKPVADAVQRLKGKQPPSEEPGPASSPEAGAPAPAPTVVTPPPPPVPTPDLTDLAVDWAQAHYQGLVNDQGGGQLLLIQGEVVNKGKSSRGPIRIKATLTDSQHRPIQEEIVYAGTTLTDQELKSLKPDEIRGWLAKPGGRTQEQGLKPGEKQPFTVVFFGVPDNLAETQSGFQLVVMEGPVAD